MPKKDEKCLGQNDFLSKIKRRTSQQEKEDRTGGEDVFGIPFVSPF